MALTDITIRNLKPRDKAYSVSDISGLSLHISRTGSKCWHFRYMWYGRPARLSLGSWPGLPLREARIRCHDHQQLLKEGIDPRVQRSREHFKKERPHFFSDAWENWVAFRGRKMREGRQTSQTQLIRISKKDILPWLGHIPVTDVKRADIITLLRRIEGRKAWAIVVKCRGWLNQFFRYAMVEYDLPLNPAADLSTIATPQPPPRHNPYLLQKEIPAFLSAVDASHARYPTRQAIKLLLLTGVRTGELRLATPQQFDLKNQLWIIPPQNVKQLQRHVSRQDIPSYVVPLSNQATSIVKDLIHTAASCQVYLLACSNNPKKQMSENTINAAIKRAGYGGLLTGHGLRATLSTALNEQDYPREWIEAQLSHKDTNEIRAAYNHARYIPQRQKMMQEWADLLDSLCTLRVP
ncbi:tyrosine-type recombinase/integrase [Enterobacter mori]|uniref:tyrosine-type recombinase/integrase n=1 Tax=Enterobacter mori TaxID=539813 RepID=UPI001B8BC2F2|nr:tyrosine-type recombinase/integrase [Enterobacter mori]MBS3046339.1 tyrosine-type recombinase/integrase [Enterobacter mori]